MTNESPAAFGRPVRADIPAKAWLQIVDRMRSPVETLAHDDEGFARLALRIIATSHMLVVQMSDALDVSRTELAVLLALWDGGRTSMADLGRRVGLKPASISQLVDRLQERGFLGKAPDTDDRRRIQIALLPTADEALMTVMKVVAAELRHNAPQGPAKQPASVTLAAFYRGLGSACASVRDHHARMMKDASGGAAEDGEPTASSQRKWW